MRLLIFLLHGGRTGSEVMLYNLIRHADRRRIEMAVACGQDGSLLKELPPDVPRFDYSQPLPVEYAGSAAKGARRLYQRALNSIYHRAHKQLYAKSPVLLTQTMEEKIARIHESFKPDAWYVNTLAQPDLLRLARARGIPCILHSHELEQMLWPLGTEDVETIVNYPKLVIAGSRAAENVLRVLGRAENLELCYESTDVGAIKSTPEAARDVRRHLKIDDDAFVWAMSGTLDPNKNATLFVEAAREMLKERPRAHFMWIGGKENGYGMFAKERAKLLYVDERVTWIPARTHDYYDYLNAADGFVLTSQRDCFPLTMIEAAALGKPIVSFDSGGVREFVQDGMGTVVRDSWNVADLVRAMRRIMDAEVSVDPRVSRRRAGEFDTVVQVKHWESVLARYLLAQ